MNALLSSMPRTVSRTRRPEPAETATDGTDIPRTPAGAGGPLASFARFVLCGGGVGVASSGAVALTAELMPWVLANALITIASTLLCTELHARFTFGAGRRAGWRQHWQSAGSAMAAYGVTCAAMFVLHLVQPSPGMVREQAVYLSAAGLAGIGRFLVLRLYVFATHRTRSPERTTSPARVKSVTVPAPSSLPAPAHPSCTRTVGRQERSRSGEFSSRCLSGRTRSGRARQVAGRARCTAAVTTSRPSPGAV